MKDAKQFKIIGKPLKKPDTRDKVLGKAVFGMDVHATFCGTGSFEAACPCGWPEKGRGASAYRVIDSHREPK